MEGDLIYFDGQNFASHANLIDVRLGGVPCVVQEPASTTTTVACLTSENGQGINLPVSVVRDNLPLLRESNYVCPLSCDRD